MRLRIPSRCSIANAILSPELNKVCLMFGLACVAAVMNIDDIVEICT